MTEEYTKLQKKTKYDYVKTAKKENFLFLNENFCKNGQTVLLGDSITELFNSYELFFAFSQKYGQAVYNRGISGDTSDRLLERLKCNALNLEPRNLVLLIGTNDLGVCLPQAFIVENIREALKMTRALCPNTNIVLQAVYPVNRHLSLAARQMVGKRRNKDIAALNAVLREVAVQYGAIWLDLTEALADKKGRLSAEYTFDGLHLNAQGFAVAAKKIIPCLK